MVRRPQWLQWQRAQLHQGAPLSVGLPIWEPLVGNWSRVKHLLEGWGLLQNWGRVKTPEAAELAHHEIEDCLEVLSGWVAAGIV